MRAREITADGAIVINKHGELIVRDRDAALHWIDESDDRLGIVPKNRIPLFGGYADHFGSLSAQRTEQLRAQLAAP